MNFKKEYEKAFADISAGDDFKKQLEKELNNAASPRRRYTPYVGVLATAAALAIMVGVVHYTGVFRGAEGLSDVEESLVAQESSGVEGNKDIQFQPSLGAEGGIVDAPGQTFQPQASWCAGVESDAEKYELFVELLGSAEAVYVSAEQGFTEENVLTDEELSELVETLSGAIAVENAMESNVKYYKAVIAEDRTIVFQIWNGKFVRIAGVETIYQLQR